MNGVGTIPITTSLLSENNIEKERKMKKIFSCIAAVWMLASCDPVTDSVKATGIEIRPSSVTLEVGKTEELTFAVLPEQAVQKVLWESSNEKIVTVKEGKVTAMAAGKAEVKAVVAENKSLTAVCTVTVTEPVSETTPVTGLTPTPAVGQPVSLTVGGTQTFGVAVVPEDASNPAVNWSVDNGAVTLSVATGMSVTVTAASAGTAVVTAVSADNSEVSVSWTVTVTAPVPESLNLEKDVPDAAFRAVLTQFDTDNDGIVSRAEADMVTELNLEWDWDSTQIQNLQGIAFFSEIEILNAAYQNLQTVDLSGNKKLKRVNLEFNYIRELDLSNQTELISSETSGSATYYGLQVGYQKESESDNSGNASITVTLPSSKESFWNETWSQNKENGYPVNQGVTVTFR